MTHKSSRPQSGSNMQAGNRGAGLIAALALAVIAAALLSVRAGAQASAPQSLPGGAPAGAQAMSPEAQNTIGPHLLQALETLPPGKQLPVIVTLEAQANLSQVAGADRAERLERLVTSLQQTAETAQRPFHRLLERRRSTQDVSQVTYFWILNGMALTATPAVISELASRPDVQSITLDETFAALELTRTGAVPSSTEIEPNLAVIDAPLLWDLGFQGQGIVVASMDTGVSASHPDLIGQWRGGTNSWFDPYGQHPTSPADLTGHGTATMGIMVGRDAGGTAIGVAPQAQWIAAKIFDDAGRATTSAVHAAFQWLLDPDGNPATADAPHVVNNSWGMGNAGCNLAFQLDLQALRAAGIVPVFSAGNAGPGDATSASPANNPEAFAVGATDNGDQIYAGSARGPSACGEPETTFPEMVAPGVSIHTTDRYGLYQTASGTSLAAPHLSGALALLLSAYPNLTAGQQEAALLSAAVDLGLPGPDNTFGQGRLDVLAAYNALRAFPALSITKLDGPDPVACGALLTYTLVITNASPIAARAVTVTDELPPEVVYGAALGDGWRCSHSGQIVTCTRPALPLGVAPAITIAVIAPEHGANISNTATVASHGVDLDPGDNTATAGTRVTPPGRIFLPAILR